MSWEQLEAIRKRQVDEADEADVYTNPRDGKPINCPVCFERLNYSGGVGDCPLGHYRTSEG